MILRLFLIFLLIALGFSARAEEAVSSEKLKAVQSQLDKQQQKADALAEKTRQASADLGNLRQKLIAATAALQDKQKEQDQLEDRLDDLEDEVDAKNQALVQSRQQLRELTGVLIRISAVPPAAYFLRTGMTIDYIHRAILLRSVLPHLRDEVETAARDLVELEELRVKATEQKRLVAAARQNLEWQRHNLDELVQARQGLLNRTEAERQTIARQLVSLSSEARDLQQLLDKVAPHARRKTPNSTGPGPALKWPVVGPVVRGFGTRDADGVTSMGLTLKAPSGSPVVAPLAGRVVFAGPFRGYGQILILQHKGGYHSFLAGFGRIDAEMGQEVAAGEPLGTLPEGGRPELYFEWRRNGEPVDPMEGISKSADTGR